MPQPGKRIHEQFFHDSSDAKRTVLSVEHLLVGRRRETKGIGRLAGREHRLHHEAARRVGSGGRGAVLRVEIVHRGRGKDQGAH